MPYPKRLDTFGGRLLALRNSLIAFPDFVRYRSQMRDVVKSLRPDLIFAGNTRALLPLVLQPAVRCPLVWNIFLGRRSRGVWWLLNEITLRAADAIVTEYTNQASDNLTRRQFQRFRHKIHTIVTAIELPANTQLPSNITPKSASWTVGFAGTLCHRKGLDLFLNAAVEMDRLDRKHPVRFFIAGETSTTDQGQYLETQKRHISVSGAEVHFLGWVDQMEWFYSNIDIFVLSSREEGMPGVVREAMARGIPVVATNVGGVRDALGDDSQAAGIVVKSEDSNEIANALLSLMNDPQTYQQLARRGRNRASSLFAIQRYADDICALFLSLASR